MADPTPGTASVTDRRTPPRGVMPRSMQAWLMIGLTAAILAIIVFTGEPAPAAAPQPAAPMAAPMNPERLRDYQDRLRVADQRTRAAQQDALSDTRVDAFSSPSGAGTPPAATPDPLVEERRRREYESLFASNLVMTRRPEAQQFVTGRVSSPTAASRRGELGLPAPPSLEEVADAVVRATSRYAPTESVAGAAAARPSEADAQAASAAPRSDEARRPVSTGPIFSTGPLHRILEGTVIETVLTNRVEGSAAAPVNCLVTSPIYSHDGQYVLIPAGSRVLGETRPVQSLGETRLAVAFNRLLFPDGSTRRLDEFIGLNDIGEAGLRDQVNQHYRLTFGASAAVGLITGFAQYLGSRGLNAGDGNRTVVIAGNVGDSTAQATAQTMNRFLNRLPTVTIREGHRVKVYLTNDLELPAYGVRRPATGSVLASTK